MVALQGIQVAAEPSMAGDTPRVVAQSPKAPASTVATPAAAPAPTAPAPAAVTPPASQDYFSPAVIDPLPAAAIAAGDSVAAVTFSAYDSYTHRFHADGSAERLVSFSWTDAATGATLGRGVSVTVDFALGTTAVRLDVVDDIGNDSAAETVVTVAGSLARGAFCFYYTDVVRALPVDAAGGPPPVHAAVAAGLSFATASAFSVGPAAGTPLRTETAKAHRG
eukprot:TRINITY_DN8445_c0_g1_i1.p2 TRINITY_DN8445_c0_g1~~TRINITY_DN8445_c0_g1_i1.p2  ORF type:complete len:222 (+),score=68.74 TRINITY_DN8445_c0_g1_i1:225-890(+)